MSSEIFSNKNGLEELQNQPEGFLAGIHDSMLYPFTYFNKTKEDLNLRFYLPCLSGFM